jgi:hypothetical protein
MGNTSDCREMWEGYMVEKIENEADDREDVFEEMRAIAEAEKESFARPEEWDDEDEDGVFGVGDERDEEWDDGEDDW